MMDPDAFMPIPSATTFEEHDDTPTLSHRLASSDALPAKSFAPLPSGGEPEVVDLGWDPGAKKDEKDAHSALAGKVEYNEVWTLVRRFDKQVQHVKEVKTAVPGGLDMNIAEVEEFSPDKLGINLERLYMTVVIGLISFGKHMARLRSWSEYFRTLCFFTTYFTAWWFDYLLPVLTVFIMVLIVAPPARRICFPPLPLKATLSAKAEKKEKGEKDSDPNKDEEITAAEPMEAPSHLSHGESVEADAASFVDTFGNIALTSAIGKEEAKGERADGKEKSAAEVSSKAMSEAEKAKEKKEAEEKNGDRSDEKHKKKKPVGEVMWEAAGPATHVLGEIADMWERIANALSPTPPFPQHVARLRIATLFIPVLVVSSFLSSYLILKGLGFFIGFAFFGSPITIHIEKKVVEHVAEIKTVMEARNTILKGVPTNAQLAVTLLRIGEASMAPLPPPPKKLKDDVEEDAKAKKEESEKHKAKAQDHDHDEAYHSDECSDTKTEEKDANENKDTENSSAEEKDGKEGGSENEKDNNDEKSDREEEKENDKEDEKESEEKKPDDEAKKPGFLVSFLQYTAAGALHTVLGTDPLRAVFGSLLAKRRLGVLNDVFPLSPAGPVEFKARYEGSKGLVLISTAATVPCISFVRSSNQEAPNKGIDMDVLWTVSIRDITEVKKVGGLGWKSRLVVGWAMEKAVVDGVEIADRGGNRWTITAMPLRDKLFDRLVSMGGQKWEVL